MQQLPADQPVDASMRTLWMGDLAYWMDESFLWALFSHSSDIANVKIIRNKVTQVSEGYGFVEFRTHESAESVLRTFNGQPIPNTDQVFRLNWAAFGVGKGTTEDYSIFVGDLAPDVSDYVLQEHFRQYFPSVRSAKVITDPVTGRSKGYGFVRFGSEQERDRALLEMNGQYVSSRPIRVSLATARKAPGGTPTPTAPVSTVIPGNPTDIDPTNTTLFIGGLSASVSEDQLRSIFGQYGEIIYTKIPQGKGCGFVQFVDRRSAESAMGEMNGTVIGNSAVRISWGRSSTKAPTGPLSQPTAAAPAYNYPASYPVASSYYDPSSYSYASAYTSADPFAGYAAYGGADAAYSAYSQAAYPGVASAGLTSGAAALASAVGQHTSAGPSSVHALYDPLAPVNIEKMNAAYISRHQPALMGAFLRAS